MDNNFFADSSRRLHYSKDPAVIHFHGQYWMYYSLPPKLFWRKFLSPKNKRVWGIGIATSSDLITWKILGELDITMPYEQRGICAPGIILKNNQIHLFYQTYGNGPKDAICHAISEDGINFQRNLTNPIIRASGDWNNGRAIDADVIIYENKIFCYWATRDPKGEMQMLGVSTASEDSAWMRNDWTQACNSPILKPELMWEQKCIEAPAVCLHDNKFFMFYGGAYNNSPQQIGCATSSDGYHWQRLGFEPFLSNGLMGTWNHSESGHPFVFSDVDGKTYLFFQGNNDLGKTWWLSWKEIHWKDGKPYLKDN